MTVESNNCNEIKMYRCKENQAEESGEKLEEILPWQVKKWLATLSEAQRKTLAKESKGWMTPTSTTVLKYDQSAAIALMALESNQKKKAFKMGAIRPFLLLVSMHPRRRAFLADLIGIDVLSTCGGNPHKEAWKIISTPMKGIQGRTNEAWTESVNPVAHNTNWYEHVYRAGKVTTKKYMTYNAKDLRQEVKQHKKSYDESVVFCKSREQEDLKQIRYLEELLIRAVIRMAGVDLNKHLTQEQIQQAKRSKEYLLVKNRLIDAGWQNAEFIELVSTVIASREVGLNAARKEYNTKIYPWQKSTSDSQLRPKEIVQVAVPAFMIPVSLLLGGLAIFSGLMLCRGVVSIIFRKSTGVLLPVILAICVQRLFLSICGVQMEQFYPKKKQHIN